MWCCKSKSSKKRVEINELTQQEQVMLREAVSCTKFTAAQIVDLYADYCSLAENEHAMVGISKEMFVEKTRILNNEWSTRLAEKIYDSIDKNDDNCVNFVEFAQYMNWIHNGTHKEKLLFSFKVIDKGKKQFLTREDLHEIFDILLNIQAVLTGEKGPSAKEVNSLLDYIIQNFDINKNNRIEWEEFNETSTKRKELSDLFQILSGSSLRAKLLGKYHEKDVEEIVSNITIVQREYNQLLAMMEHMDPKAGRNDSQDSLQ